MAALVSAPGHVPRAACAGSAEEGVSARDVSRVRGVLLPRRLRAPALPHRVPRGRVPARAPAALGGARHARPVSQGEVTIYYANQDE